MPAAAPDSLCTVRPPLHLRRRAAPRRWLAPLASLALAACAAATAMAATPLPSATDLGEHGRDAGRRGQPLVLLLSLPDCGYCEAVRRSYLGPMAAAGQITARELDIAADTPLRDADGKLTSARAWARARGQAFAPTVLFLDARGHDAAPPLRGMQADFYGAYLDQRLDEARAALAAPR